jgi:hypothetical protein
VHISHRFTAVLFSAAVAAAQQPSAPEPPATALTIYNDNFAVARTTLNLDLHPGLNSVETNQVTNLLEPDSVVLRDMGQPDASQKPSFRILEQNYESAVVTQDWLLQKYEGKTILFANGRFTDSDGKMIPGAYVEGKIIRGPTQTQDPNYGYQRTEPLIEVGGQMQFGLPGTPLFPASTDGLLLKPALRWQIETEKAQKVKAELAYITNGLSWEATYNVVAGTGGAATEGAQKADLLGWVTINNHSGADFPKATIKLMAGDVAKIQPQKGFAAMGRMVTAQSVMVANEVTQQAFDDFHLYDLHRTVSLAEGETKQVQFLEGGGISVERHYLYDGSGYDRLDGFMPGMVNQTQNLGLNDSNPKVRIIEEIRNTEANHLGIPLPAGRLRFYRRDADGQMEFVGESMINHTPAEDTIKVTTGDAFDVKGARRQTDFFIDTSRRTLDEYFEIAVTNQKTEAVTVDVLEHLYRGDNWEIQQKSADFTKLDSHTIEFPVQVPAKGKTIVTYKVRYTW